MKTKEIRHRQSLVIWEARRSIGESFKDRIPADTITRLQATASIKIERSFVIQIGAEIECEDGHLWKVTGTRAFMKKHNSKQKGKASIAWMTLAELASERTLDP